MKWLPVPPENAIRRLSPDLRDSDTPDSSGSDEAHQRWITERTQLVPATEGPPGVFHGIISKPSQRKFHRCEDEPIHTPGVIQQYGVLLALKYSKDGNLEVRIASENSRLVLERSPEQLFGLESFVDILDAESREDLIERINHALVEASVSKTTEDTHLEVFSVRISLPDRTFRELWCALHISKGTTDLIILEFEEYHDVFHLVDQYSDKTLPKEPVQTVDIDVCPIERLKSTTSESAPLRVLQLARKGKRPEVTSMSLFNAMNQAQSQLSEAKSVQNVMDIVVGIISDLTGFHRVMFYRFDSDKNGCVEAELVNPKASLDLFRGLHFPASDIPQQARALYKINRIRILYDRDAETARLVMPPFSTVYSLLHNVLSVLIGLP